MDNIITLHWRNLKMSYDNLISTLMNNPGKNYSIQQAEDLAKKVLEAGNYGNVVGPVPIVNIAKNFGFLCLKAKNMPNDISGNIFVGGTTKNVYNSDKVIIVAEDEKIEHIRFIIAHELGHYLLDYIGGEEAKDCNSLFSRAYPKQNHFSDEELRADRFAAELLMPANIFLKQYVKVMEISDYDKKYAISYLSKFFKTKKSSIQRRIEEVIS